MWEPANGIPRWKRIARLVLIMVLCVLASEGTAFQIGRRVYQHIRRRNFHSPCSVLKAARLPCYFSVGDSVVVADTKEIGVIHEVRGSGWYAVSIAKNEDKDSSVLKFRSSQLEPVIETQNQFIATSENNPLPVVPTIIDYDDPSLPLDPALRLQLDTFRQYQHWIVFSDLHCSAASLDTCRQVLDTVHTHAVELNAGVLFLGDFWHVRGTLRVATLNAVLDQLRTTWTQPLIAIPGNHDQCTWKTNENHALQPLRDAYRIPATNNSNATTVSGVLLFSNPCRYQNALWLPHLRDPAVVRSLMQQKKTSIVFCHVDCYGASRNDQAMSTGGIRLADLPAHVPVYSGHYHAPHVLEEEDRVLEYVGSPYQVTLSEANQEKRLLLLECCTNTTTWRRRRDLPIHIGRRHHVVSSIDDLKALQPRTGDRIVATVAQADVAAISHTAQPLREAGVTIEVRTITPTVEKARKTAITGGVPVEELSPLSVWQRFCTFHNHTDLVHTTGKEILGAMEQPSMTQQRLLEQHDGPNHLVLESVTLQGFGPFADQVTYPLHDRGLVLLSGVNDDDDGADSNGSGKTSLVMSVLWALTGSIDPRPLQDSKAADVVNDHCSVSVLWSYERNRPLTAQQLAQVTVTGTLNGKETVVCRSKTSSKGRLTLVLDGRDITAPSIRETQDLLDEALGVPTAVVARSLFQGQHLAQSELLDATDVKFKTELSLVVPLDLWNAAAAEARQRAKQASISLAELGGMRSLRMEDLCVLEDKIETLLSEVQLKEEKHATAVKELAEFQECDTIFESGPTPTEIETEMKQIERRIGDLEEERATTLVKEEVALQAVANQQVQVEEQLLHHLERKSEAERRVAEQSTKCSLAQQKLERLGEMWEIDLSDKFPDSIRIPDRCPVCQQSVIAHGSLRQSVEDEVYHALESLADCSALKKDAETLLAHMAAAHNSTSGALEVLSIEVRNIRDQSKSSLLEVEARISDERQRMNDLSYFLASKVKQADESSEPQELQTACADSKADWDFARRQLVQLHEEKKRHTEWIEKVEAETDELSRILGLMKNIAEMFSARGIQTFVLQNALAALESSMHTYLSHLSGGALRMELAMTEKLERRVYVRNAKGVFIERPLGALSGGQWRRCSMALQLAFIDLVGSQFRCSLAVWDEPLTHLDEKGRMHVGTLFRGLLTNDKFSTVLMILQDLSADELGESFDEMDEVRRSGDRSEVHLGRHELRFDSS